MQRKITFSFVSSTPQVGLHPVALDLKGLSQDPIRPNNQLIFRIFQKGGG